MRQGEINSCVLFHAEEFSRLLLQPHPFKVTRTSGADQGSSPLQSSASSNCSYGITLNHPQVRQIEVETDQRLILAGIKALQSQADLGPDHVGQGGHLEQVVVRSKFCMFEKSQVESGLELEL